MEVATARIELHRAPQMAQRLLQFAAAAVQHAESGMRGETAIVATQRACECRLGFLEPALGVQAGALAAQGLRAGRRDLGEQAAENCHAEARSSRAISVTTGPQAEASRWRNSRTDAYQGICEPFCK